MILRIKAVPQKWILAGLAAALILAFPAPTSLAAPQERHFRIEASSFQFSPSILHVNPGDLVTIDLVAMDYVHGLAIDTYNVDIHADPGQITSVTFTAGKPGSYRFRCSVACGSMHPFMIGRLAVGPNWLLVRGAGLTLLAVLAGIALASGPPSQDKLGRTAV